MIGTIFSLMAIIFSGYVLLGLIFMFIIMWSDDREMIAQIRKKHGPISDPIRAGVLWYEKAERNSYAPFHDNYNFFTYTFGMGMVCWVGQNIYRTEEEKTQNYEKFKKDLGIK